MINTIPLPVQGAVTQATDAGSSVAQAAEQLVDAVVNASIPAGAAPAAVDDSLLTVVVWIIDAAGAIAKDAANLTQTAAATDAKAQQVAECARTWSLVAAIVAVVVTIVVSIVMTIFSFGGGGSLVAAAVTAVCAVVSAVVTIIQSVPAIIQANVVAALVAIPPLTSATTSPTDRARISSDTTENLRRTMTMIQGAAAQHQPAVSVDLTKSLATATQMSRALQKLLGLLRQRPQPGRMALVVTEFSQLAQTHAAIATQLSLTRPAIVVPGVVGPVSPTAPTAMTTSRL
jgi:hypothetical protein